jgi:nucleotide-binding universal stress UspA family protein
MYRKILVAYNGTPESMSALHECIHLQPDPSTEIHLLGVIGSPTPPIVGDLGRPSRFDPDERLAEEKKKMDRELTRGLTILKDAGLIPVVHLEVGEPVAIIEEMVKKLSIELVIVGHARHRSWSNRWWRGSTDALLIEKISCTLMIAPERHQ